MTNGSKLVPLGKLLEIQNGFAFKSKEFSETEGMPLVRIRDLKTGAGTVVNYLGDYDKQYLVEPGDLLIGMDGEFQCHEWQGKNALLNQRVCKLVNFSDDLLPRFLFFGINKYLKEIEDRTSFTTVKHLSSKTIKSILFPVPPPEEQRRIVEVLDEAFKGLDRARAHAEANLRDSKKLFDGAISTCFRNIPEHSTHSTLGQLAAFRNGLNFTRTSQGDKVKVVGVGDFRDNFEVPVSEINSARIDGNLDEHDRLRSGDILVVRSNGNRQLIGRTMLVPETDESISFSGFTIRIRLKSDCIFPEYLCSYMRTKEARENLSAGGGGTNISNLNQRLLSSFPIVFPDTDVQLKVLDRVQIIQSTKLDLYQHYENMLRDLDDLRQSLLQRAFAGELT